MPAPTGYAGALALSPAFDPNATQDVIPQSSAHATATQDFFPPLVAGPPAQALRAPGRLIAFRQSPEVPSGMPQPAAAAPPLTPPVTPPAAENVSSAGYVQVPLLPPQPVLVPPAGSTRDVRGPRAPRKQLQPLRSSQGNFDFVSAPLAQPTLKTGAVGQVACQLAVARPVHRCLAGAVDATAIFFCFGAFVIVASLFGASFGDGKLLFLTLGANFSLFALFYGVLCLIARRPSVGMDLVDLQLVTFEGRTLEPRDRVVRFLTTILSIGAAGLGVFWAVADEENLTWHDHISKSFPTQREGSSNYLREHSV